MARIWERNEGNMFILVEIVHHRRIKGHIGEIFQNQCLVLAGAHVGAGLLEAWVPCFPRWKGWENGCTEDDQHLWVEVGTLKRYEKCDFLESSKWPFTKE